MWFQVELQAQVNQGGMGLPAITFSCTALASKGLYVQIDSQMAVSLSFEVS